MIKYYDTQEAYEADIKSKFESSVSLVGSSNEIKYDGHNVVVGIKSAKTYDIAYLDENKALRFISSDTFDKDSFPSNFEAVGVVGIGVDHPEFRGKVTILNAKIWPPDEPNIFLKAIKVVITDFVLDGTDRTITLKTSIGPSSSDVRTYEIPYNATSEEELVEQLNNFFKSDEGLVQSEYMAYVDAIGVRLQCKNFGYASSISIEVKSGAKLLGNYMFDINAVYPLGIYIKNRRGVEYTSVHITSIPEAIKALTADTSSTNINPTSVVAETGTQYPICLPAYLGKSTYRGEDYCYKLRVIYGEGRDGWIEYLKSCLALTPSYFGGMSSSECYAFGFKKLKDVTRHLASIKYKDYETGEWLPNCQLAIFIQNMGYANELLKKGEWYIPDLTTLYNIIKDDEYVGPSQSIAFNTFVEAFKKINQAQGDFLFRSWSASILADNIYLFNTRLIGLGYLSINNIKLHCISTTYASERLSNILAVVQIDVK